MDINEFHTIISPLYVEYNEVIKPLIAELEAREEASPQPIFNEIRAFNDHIARCYRDDIESDKIAEEIEKAQRHIKRITLDCFKYLNVSLYEKIHKFEKQTKNIDLTVINNGLFYPKYRRLMKLTVQTVRQAKKEETVDTNRALEVYQEGYNLYCALEELIDDNLEVVKWARIKFSFKRTLSVIGWLLTAIISGLLSIFISCDFLRKMILE